MRYFELNEGRDAVLYHGIKDINYATMALKNNELLCTSTQRFWADGKRRKDDDPEYTKSFWMKGVSMTRDIEFAKKWGAVVLIIDQRFLAQRYKIIPFNWGFSIPYGNNHKNEREEFVVGKSTWDTYTKFNPETNKTSFELDRFRTPEGSIKNLNTFLKGFLVLDWYKEDNYWEKYISFMEQHPKFIGYYHMERKYGKNKTA